MAKGFVFFSGLGGSSLFGGVVMSFPVTLPAGRPSSGLLIPEISEESSGGWLLNGFFCFCFSNTESSSVGKLYFWPMAGTGSGEMIKVDAADCPSSLGDFNWDALLISSCVHGVSMSLAGTGATSVSESGATSLAGFTLLARITSVPGGRATSLVRATSVSGG